MNDFYRQQEVYVYSIAIVEVILFNIKENTKRMSRRTEKLLLWKTFSFLEFLVITFFTLLPFFILTLWSTFLWSHSRWRYHIFLILIKSEKLFFSPPFLSFCIFFIIIDRNAARLVSCRNIIDLLLYMMTFLNNFVIIHMWR